MGYSVDGANDVNGDGFGDVVIGAHDYDGYGRGYVYYGSQSGMTTTNTVVTLDTTQNDFGFSVAGVGDTNGDGYADILIVPTLDLGSSNYHGRVYKFQEVPMV